MNLFIMFVLGTFLLGMRLAKEDVNLSYVAAAGIAAFLAFAYFYLGQI